MDDPWTASEGLPARHPVRMGRSVGIPSCLSAHRALRSPKWKAASTIVEGLFHSAQFFCGRPILFLTLMARLGYDKSYSSGTDPIKLWKLRKPTPLTGQVGMRTALRKDCGKGRMSIVVRRSEHVIDLTLFAPMFLYVATSKQT